MDATHHALADLVRSSRAGVGFHDLQGRCRARARDPRTLVVTGSFPKGLYQMALETAAGTFPVDSLMLHLKEWPTLATVEAGPFDFDHTTYRMAVPTFRVTVDTRDCGLVWCEVPSPADVRARRIRAVWGIPIDRPGEHEIVLTQPGDDTRLRWADVERVVLQVDPRRSAPLGGLSRVRAARPRLFTNPEQLDALTRRRDPVQQAMLEDLRGQLVSGADGTYVHRTVTAALVGRVTGETRWADEAVARTLDLCAKPYWGYHDVPEVMGWNNDRDTGMRLFETAVAYDWLHERFTPAQRQDVRAKLAYHADLADRVTHIQKGYWYTRSNEAHGQGLWFGFACAALALVGDDPRAEAWLDWVHGNMLDALAHMPDDGITEWPVFNAQWLILTTVLLERATGRRLRGRMPFLRRFAPSIGKLRGCAALGTSRADKLPMLLFWLARRLRDGRAQADALAEAGLSDPTARPDAPPLDPLAIVAYDPRLDASRPSRPADALCSENGTVLCRDVGSRAEFVFRCGTPLTPRHHDGHEWIAQAWFRCQHGGSFGWHVGGRELVPLAVAGYRVRTRDANVVTINGAGHRMDARWLGAAIPVEHTGRTEWFASGAGVTFCHANVAPAYMPESGVRHLTRRWVFFHRSCMLVLHDVVATTEPCRLAWHVHTRGQWRRLDPLAFVAEVDGQRLAIRALAPNGDRAGAMASVGNVLAEVGPTHYVPPYSLGLNAYKTLEWQPEVHRRRVQPPDFQELTYGLADPADRWDFVTVMGPDVDRVMAARRDDSGGGTVVSLGPVGEVCWSPDGPTPIDALGADVDADLVVHRAAQHGGGRWVLFGTRHVRGNAYCHAWDEPVDLIWDPRREAPQVIGRRTPRSPRPSPAHGRAKEGER